MAVSLQAQEKAPLKLVATIPLLARIPGSFRAKTGILVPELNRYYLAVPHHENKDAEVRVYEIQP
jgi:hypothetical protein